MADNAEMNALLRQARGIEVPDAPTPAMQKRQHAEMNRLLREARGFTVEAPTEEDDADA